MRHPMHSMQSATPPCLSAQARSLTRYCHDLRHLIYWMENDRSLDAQPEKIVELRHMLLDMEEQLAHRAPLRKTHVVAGASHH